MDTCNQISEFITQHPDDLVEFLKQTYKLTVKTADSINVETETEHPDDRILIRYHRDKSDMTDNIVKFCRGVIFDGKTGKLVCSNFQGKSPTDPSVQYLHSSVITEVIDGTMVNLYHYQNKWYLSTKGCLDANQSFWASNYSFGELFQDIWRPEADLLDPDCCYSFVLQHPENRIVTKVSKPALYLVQVKNLKTDEVCVPYQDMSEHVMVPKCPIFKLPTRHYFATQTELEGHMAGLTYEHPGFMVITQDHDRVKIDNPEYMRVVALRGNTPDRLHNLLKLGKTDVNTNGLVEEYLSYYPEDTEIWEQVEILTRRCLGSLLYYYNRVMKQHRYTPIPVHLRQSIHILHELYRNKKQDSTTPFRITHRVIKGYFHSLPTKQQTTVLNRHNDWLHNRETDIETLV